MASIVILCKPLLDAASGKIPILSDFSVEEASPVSFLSFPGKKENEETTGVLRRISPREFMQKRSREKVYIHFLTAPFACPFYCFKNSSTKRSVSARSCCAVVPRMARPGRTLVVGIAARILSGVLVRPLPSCVQKGITVFPEKS